MRAIKMLNKMHKSKADQRARTASSAAKLAGEHGNEGRSVVNMGHEHDDLEPATLRNKDKLSDSAERQNP